MMDPGGEPGGAELLDRPMQVYLLSRWRMPILLMEHGSIRRRRESFRGVANFGKKPGRFDSFRSSIKKAVCNKNPGSVESN